MLRTDRMIAWRCCSWLGKVPSWKSPDAGWATGSVGNASDSPSSWAIHNPSARIDGAHHMRGGDARCRRLSDRRPIRSVIARMCPMYYKRTSVEGFLGVAVVVEPPCSVLMTAGPAGGQIGTVSKTCSGRNYGRSHLLNPATFRINRTGGKLHRTRRFSGHLGSPQRAPVNNRGTRNIPGPINPWTTASNPATPWR